MPICNICKKEIKFGENRGSYVSNGMIAYYHVECLKEYPEKKRDRTLEYKTCTRCNYPVTDVDNINKNFTRHLNCDSVIAFHNTIKIKERDHSSEEKTTFSSGASCSALKPRFDLICPIGLKRIALRYALGSEKYSDYNWCKGIPPEVRLNHLINHITEYLLYGNTKDDNLAAIAWNAIALMHYEENCKHHEAPWISEERKKKEENKKDHV